MGFRVQGSEVGAQGAGFRGQVSGFRVWGDTMWSDVVRVAPNHAPCTLNPEPCPLSPTHHVVREHGAAEDDFVELGACGKEKERIFI